MKKILKNIPKLFLLTAILAGLIVPALAQKPPKPPDKKAPVALPEPAPMTAPVAKWPVPPLGGGADYERSLIVDPKVKINMCIVTGNVKITGWSRNEVRVFINDGSPVNLNVREKDRKSERPVLIDIAGHDLEKVKNKKMPMLASECIWGGEIEIDVPMNASLEIKGDETTIGIDSVRKASVKNAGGSISLRNITEGAQALTYEGNVTVNDSRGIINLESSSGNILAFNVGPEEIGDTFKAKTTSGKIFLQNIEQRQIEVNSITGAILYSGKIFNGGLYTLSTSNGTITMSMPADSSAKLNASYGFGQFNSDITLRDVVPNNTPRFKSLTAVMGAGEATLKLTTNDGSIKIKKLP
jgi:Putative adhesin